MSKNSKQKEFRLRHEDPHRYCQANGYGLSKIKTSSEGKVKFFGDEFRENQRKFSQAANRKDLREIKKRLLGGRNENHSLQRSYAGGCK